MIALLVISSLLVIGSVTWAHLSETPPTRPWEPGMPFPNGCTPLHNPPPRDPNWAPLHNFRDEKGRDLRRPQGVVPLHNFYNGSQ